MKPVAYTRPSMPADIPIVASNMRDADVQELQASSEGKPKEALLRGLLTGKPCMTICKADGTPVAMWGVAPQMDDVGVAWLLGTKELVEDRATRMRFLREVKAQVTKVMRTYRVLWNCVDARNTVHIRWIRWMGFTFIAKHPNYGAEGRLFLEFCKVSHV